MDNELLERKLDLSETLTDLLKVVNFLKTGDYNLAEITLKNEHSSSENKENFTFQLEENQLDLFRKELLTRLEDEIKTVDINYKLLKSS